MPGPKEMPIMKKPTPAEWIAMAIITTGLALIIVMVANQPPKKLPQVNHNICPLCERPYTVHL
jgi:hypothetical protein